jgi:transcription elongation factor GreA
MGDLSENAEYHEARAEQSFNEGRILEIENVLKNAVMVGERRGKGVQIGSKVRVSVNGQERDFVIVGSNEGNPSQGLISCDSPLGEAMINKEVADAVKVVTPKGVFVYKVISIK